MLLPLLAATQIREHSQIVALSETVVARCIKEKIVGLEAFGVDASMTVADAGRRRGVVKVGDLDPTSSSSGRRVSPFWTTPPSGAATPKEPSISPTDPAARYPLRPIRPPSTPIPTTISSI